MFYGHLATMNFFTVIFPSLSNRTMYTPFLNLLTSIFLVYCLPASTNPLLNSKTFLPSIVNMVNTDVPLADGTKDRVILSDAGFGISWNSFVIEACVSSSIIALVTGLDEGGPDTGQAVKLSNELLLPV